MALIGSSSDQEAVMAAMDGVDARRYPQVYIGFFGYTNFLAELTGDGGETCLALINNPWPGTQRGQWNDVPCNKNL